MKMNDFLKQEIETNFFQQPIDWNAFHGKSIMITGATGLIGSMVCRVLSCIGKIKELNVNLIAVVRDREKANRILADVMENGNISFLEQDIAEPIQMENHVHYVIHTACPTASGTFIKNPVETIQAIVNGTENVLKFAKRAQSESVVYLSSMEAYGQILHENPLLPEDVGYINPLSLRSCYPEGKRMAENLCVAYCSEYQVPVKIIRLAQTFGPGIDRSDKRVFAQFLHSALNKENIVMYTEGGSKRMYLDTMDAVSACIIALLKGENGCVYNAGNPDTYCSIKQMAELVLKEFGEKNAKVVVDKSKNIGQYPPDNMLYLDVSSLKNLGWTPKYDLKNMYYRMLQ